MIIIHNLSLSSIEHTHTHAHSLTHMEWKIIKYMNASRKEAKNKLKTRSFFPYLFHFQMHIRVRAARKIILFLLSASAVRSFFFFRVYHNSNETTTCECRSGVDHRVRDYYYYVVSKQRIGTNTHRRHLTHHI